MSNASDDATYGRSVLFPRGPITKKTPPHMDHFRTSVCAVKFAFKPRKFPNYEGEVFLLLGDSLKPLVLLRGRDGRLVRREQIVAYCDLCYFTLPDIAWNGLGCCSAAVRARQMDRGRPQGLGADDWMEITRDETVITWFGRQAPPSEIIQRRQEKTSSGVDES